MADPVNGTVLPVPGEVPASASARDAEAETAVAAAPSLLARTLGHASAEAEVKAKVHDATEGVHNDELPKAEHTPQQVKDIAAADNEVPAVAAGDSDVSETACGGSSNELASRKTDSKITCRGLWILISTTLAGARTPTCLFRE